MNEINRQIQREVLGWVRTVCLYAALLCAFAMLAIALFVSDALVPFMLASFFAGAFIAMRWAAGR